MKIELKGSLFSRMKHTDQRDFSEPDNEKGFFLFPLMVHS